MVWWATLGFILLQVGWIAAVPPYRGIDEFDHAYRAAAVARGEWMAPPSDATRGTGAMVTVPSDIVEAANPVCAGYRYTTSVDCRPSGDQDDGMVSVASGAGRYHPAYYWVVGTVALPFDGYPALYAMRIASAAVCAALFALAMSCVARWSRSAWPLAAVAVASTPVLVYSSTIVAPNGTEMLAGLVVWAALLGLVRAGADRSQDRWLVRSAAVGACVLVTVRSLGPLWLAGIVAAVALVAPWRDAGWRSTLGRRRLSGPVAFVGVAGAAAVTWTLTQRSLVIGVEDNDPQVSILHGLTVGLRSLVLWVLQAEAAFPTRTEQAPVVVYACGILALLGLLVWAAVRGRRREVVVAGLVGVAALAVPLVITAATYNDYGAAWQGRYGLPLAVGVPLLAGVALDRATRLTTLDFRGIVLAGVVWGLAHVVGTVDVLVRESTASPLVGTGHWWPTPAPVVAVVCSLGVAAWVVAALRAEQQTAPGRGLPLVPAAQMEARSLR